MFTITIKTNPCEVIMFSAILTTFFFHKLPRFRKVQCADLNGINLPTRNTETLKGEMQLPAIAICQIETTGIEPVPHDIHIIALPLSYVSYHACHGQFFSKELGWFSLLFHSTVIQAYLSELIVFSIASIGLYPRFCKICLKTVTD